MHRATPNLRARDTRSSLISANRVRDSGRFVMRQLVACDCCTLMARVCARRKNNYERGNRPPRALYLTTMISICLPAQTAVGVTFEGSHGTLISLQDKQPQPNQEEEGANLNK